MVMKLKECNYKITHIVAANSPWLPHLVLTFYFYFDVNIKNDRKKRRKNSGVYF